MLLLVWYDRRERNVLQIVKKWFRFSSASSSIHPTDHSFAPISVLINLLVYRVQKCSLSSLSLDWLLATRASLSNRKSAQKYDKCSSNCRKPSSGAPAPFGFSKARTWWHCRASDEPNCSRLDGVSSHFYSIYWSARAFDYGIRDIMVVKGSHLYCGST